MRFLLCLNLGLDLDLVAKPVSRSVTSMLSMQKVSTPDGKGQEYIVDYQLDDQENPSNTTNFARGFPDTPSGLKAAKEYRAELSKINESFFPGTSNDFFKPPSKEAEKIWGS